MKESHFDKEADFESLTLKRRQNLTKILTLKRRQTLTKKHNLEESQRSRQEDRTNTWTNVLTLLAGKGFLGPEVSHQGALDLCGLKDSGFLKDAPWTTHMLYHESCA